MALKYWVAKNGTWSGSTGDGTETSPYDGAIAVRNALGTGIVANDIVIFMGEYGPVDLAELLADWPIGSNYTITTAIGATANFPAPTDTAAFRGGILFGTSSGTSSNASNIEFQFRGDIPWHIDARGGNATTQRMMAAITVQGYKTKITGLRVAAPDWDYTITAGRIAATVPNSSYPQNSSLENIGLISWGSVGSTISNCTCWGSDAFSRYACYVGYSTTVGQTASGDDTVTEIKNNTFYGSAICLEVVAAGTLVPTAAVPDRLLFGRRAVIDIHDNVAYGARWGDRLSTPTINQARYTGGMFSVQFLGAFGSHIRFHDNEAYGDCQDAVQMICVNSDCYDNYVHDLNPGKTTSDTFTRYTHSAGTWTTTTNNYIGDGIKLGLDGNDDSVTGATWNSLGTATIGFEVDALRNACYRNRVVNPTNFGITSNGSGGMQIVFNEVTGSYRGLMLSDVDTGLQQQYWVANNYFEGSDRGVEISSRNTVFFYNNIFDGGGVYDIGAATATGATLYGSNNILANSQQTYGTTVNNMTDNVLGAAAYTAGVGPTPGGNCDGTGVPNGLRGMRAPTRTLRDIAGDIVDMTNVPIGPRQ